MNGPVSLFNWSGLCEISSRVRLHKEMCEGVCRAYVSVRKTVICWVCLYCMLSYCCSLSCTKMSVRSMHFRCQACLHMLHNVTNTSVESVAECLEKTVTLKYTVYHSTLRGLLPKYLHVSNIVSFELLLPVRIFGQNPCGCTLTSGFR